MNTLIHFHHNNCLFKCDMHMFNCTIKNVLTNLFEYDCDDSPLYVINESDLHVLDDYSYNDYVGIVRCVICLQTISIITGRNISPFMICDICINTCIDMYNFIEICVGLPFFGIRSYWVINNNHYEMCLGSSTVLDERGTIFVNNSHKLVYRFYHVAPIIFLMSISDNNSHCNELNLDVIIHILKFIY